MRPSAPVIVLGLAVAGCGGSDASQAGWHYDEAALNLSYRAADGRGLDGAFIGLRCESDIVFGVIHGGYGDSVRSFTVSAGAWHKTYPAFRGEHGRALIFPGTFPSLDGDRLAAGLAAGQGIVIRADDGWTLSVPGDPIVGQFVKDCGVVNGKRRTLADG